MSSRNQFGRPEPLPAELLELIRDKSVPVVELDRSGRAAEPLRVIIVGHGAHDAAKIRRLLEGSALEPKTYDVHTVNVGTIGHIDYGKLERSLTILDDALVVDDAASHRSVIDEITETLGRVGMLSPGHTITIERQRFEPLEFGVKPTRHSVPQGKGKSRADKQNRWR